MLRGLLTLWLLSLCGGTHAATNSTLPTVAVCISANRATYESVQNVKENVVRPLHADLFVHYGYTAGLSKPNPVLFRDATMLMVEEDIPPHELTRMLDQTPFGFHYRGCTKTGNSLSPAFNRMGGALYLYKSQLQCLRMIEKHEATRRNGTKYQRVVWTRVDLFWVYPHPPLERLALEVAWIPTGEDWSGYYDRHVVASRRIAAVYLTRWLSVMDGSASRLIRRGSLCRSAENFLKYHLARHGIPVGRFPAVAGRSCCLSANFTCYRHNFCSIRQLPYQNRTHPFKQCTESLTVITNAKALIESHGDWNSLGRGSPTAWRVCGKSYAGGNVGKSRKRKR